MSKEISAHKVYTAYKRADAIIHYLLNPDDDTIQLTDTEKKTLNYCKEIHGYRLRYFRKPDIVGLMKSMHNLQDRQIYNLINETEEIFGKVGKVHKEYERQFLINASLKNIEIAMAGRNSTQITKALLAHYKIAGLEEFIPDMPDFSKLEQHKYIIGIPTNVLDTIKGLMKGGSLRLSDFIPAPTRDTSQFDEAKEAPDESA